jgi:hypothetical protein
VDSYRSTGKPKAAAKPDRPNDQGVWTYCGHHLVCVDSKMGTFDWKNSNESTGADRPDQRCWGDNAWEAQLKKYQLMDPCPGNSPGNGSKTFGGDPPL